MLQTSGTAAEAVRPHYELRRDIDEAFGLCYKPGGGIAKAIGPIHTQQKHCKSYQTKLQTQQKCC